MRYNMVASPKNVPPQQLQDLLTRSVALFRERKGDWNAFADSKTEGFRRAQHRYIGAGASGKQDTTVIEPGSFTLSVMFLPIGQGNPPHTHEVEEAFFVLKGHVTFFFDDENGNRVQSTLGPWDCISAPANVIHGLVNDGLEDAWMQVMLGKGKPGLMTYENQEFQKRRAEHLTP